MAAAETPNHPEGADEAQVGRRVVLRGISAMGLAAFAAPLAACGGDDEPAVSAPGPSPEATVEAPAPSPGAKTPKPGKSPAASPAGSPKASPAASPKASPKATPKPSGGGGGTPVGPAFADASAVPVGSGALFEADEIIVTQPTAGKFVGFDDLCTHEGCIIDVFEGNQMICTCHNSKFNITDGKPTAGPAKTAVPQKKIVVKDGKIYKAT